MTAALVDYEDGSKKGPSVNGRDYISISKSRDMPLQAGSLLGGNGRSRTTAIA
jgi:hypothetical protein